MSLDWHAALQAVLHHPLFGVGITLAAYQAALAAYERGILWLDLVLLHSELDVENELISASREVKSQ